MRGVAEDANGAPPQRGELGCGSRPPLEESPGREMVPGTKNGRVLLANPEIHLKQSKRYAEAALAHYNKRKKIKIELVDVKPCNSVAEPRCCYTHINFTARPIKESSSQEQLFFAELYHCDIRPDNIAASSSKTVGQKFLKPDGASGVRKHADFTYCFACSQRMSHPKGEKYVAGHSNIPLAKFRRIKIR